MVYKVKRPKEVRKRMKEKIEKEKSPLIVESEKQMLQFLEGKKEYYNSFNLYSLGGRKRSFLENLEGGLAFRITPIKETGVRRIKRKSKTVLLQF